jgi:Ethylbenzene dehydrogenase
MLSRELAAMRRPIIRSLYLLPAVGLIGAAELAAAPPAEQTLEARQVDHAIVLDGEIDDWADIAGITVPLSGTGGADRVELKAALRGERIYVLAVWDDPTENNLHKPYVWNEELQAYEKTEVMEDRLAISFAMRGNFSADKLDGSEFETDVWHWKASRSNPAGLAHDKYWKVSRTPFEGSRAFESPNGGMVHLARPSDAGDWLYKHVRYFLKQADVMPLYEVNMHPKGSIADVQARGVWREGRWYLELSRALSTGHEDDTVIPASGSIEMALAAFDGVSHNVVDGGMHSVSAKLRLRTLSPSS